MPLLDQSFYQSIRRRLDISLTATDLSDETIEDPMFLGAAERWLAAAIPGSEDLEDDALAHAQAAIVLYTASLIAPSLPSLTAQTLEGTGSYQRKAVDWMARAAALRAEASAELAAILPTDALEPGPIPTMFAVAHGYRGR